MENLHAARQSISCATLRLIASSFGRFRLQRRGVTAVEYGIVAAFLCLSLLGIFKAFGSVISTMFSGVSSGV